MLIILGLAAFGAYSLIEKMGGPAAPAETVAAAQQEGLISGLGSMALKAAASASGIKTADLPEEGCSDSAMSADNVNSLLATLPEGQSQVLSDLLSSGSTILSIQMYSGTLGMGLCIPAKNMVVLLPQKVQQSVSGILPTSAE
ncbi:hypothetical protein [Novimethylophilus kurashikiensis]|nr:hypothetical protein [Novimethylophilus kurashikiensis]